MVKRCLVCNLSYVKGSTRSFHKVPKNAITRNMWQNALFIGNSIALPEFSYICSDHFDESDYDKKDFAEKQFVQLKKSAVPKPLTFQLTKNNNSGTIVQSKIENLPSISTAISEVKDTEVQCDIPMLTIKLQNDDIDFPQRPNINTDVENCRPQDNSGTACRLCLIKNKDTIVYTVNFRITHKTISETLGEMLKKYTSIEIQPEDKKSQNICESCVRLLWQSYNFFEMCIKSECILDSMINCKTENTLENEPETLNTGIIEKHVETVEEDALQGGTNINCRKKIEPDGPVKRKYKRREHPEENCESNDGTFKCCLCNGVFANFDEMYKHYEDIHVDEKRCPICNRFFKRDYILRYHIKRHNTTAHSCQRCFEVFPNVQDLKEHLGSFQHLHPKSCTICKKTFKSKYTLGKHMKSHTGEKEFKCHICEKLFTYRENLHRHLKRHAGQAFLCYLCGKSFTTLFVLKRHIALNHRKQSLKRYPNEPPTKQYVQEYCCEICGKVFKSHIAKRNYEIHLWSHTDASRHCCKYCKTKTTFESKEALRNHVKNVHETFKCEHCNKGFRQKCFLKYHYAKHKEEPEYHIRCNVCGKTLKTKQILLNHMRTHTGEKPYSCRICGKAFRQHCHLRSHMFTHFENKPHKCAECGKAFGVPSELKAHERVHTGERPFPCQFCDKAFRSSTCLLKHKRKTHSDIIKNEQNNVTQCENN